MTSFALVFAYVQRPLHWKICIEHREGLGKSTARCGRSGERRGASFVGSRSIPLFILGGVAPNRRIKRAEGKVCGIVIDEGMTRHSFRLLQ